MPDIQFDECSDLELCKAIHNDCANLFMSSYISLDLNVLTHFDNL